MRFAKIGFGRTIVSLAIVIGPIGAAAYDLGDRVVPRSITVAGDGHEIPTTVASMAISTTTSTLGYDAGISFGVFPTETLSSIEVGVKYDDRNYGGVEDLDLSHCTATVADAVTTHDGTSFHLEFDAASGGFMQSQNVLFCSWYTHEPASPPDEDWFIPSLTNARSVAGGAVAAMTSLCVTHFAVNGVPPDPGEHGYCGDATGDDQVNATDALRALQAGVGSHTCAGSRCDTDANGTINASDALRILKHAVGVSGVLFCRSPCS